MGIYDLLMLAVMVGCIMFGLWKGFAWQVASIAAIFVSYFVAMIFRGPLSGYISVSEPWNRFAAMLILFLATSLIIWMAYGYIKKTIKRLRLRGFDTQAGAILGAFKGIILCMLVTLFSVTLFGERVRQGVVNSRSGGYFAAAINKTDAFVPREIHALLDPHIQNFNQAVTGTDAGFLDRSKQKLEEKIQIFQDFHGQFERPKSRVANVPQPPAANPARAAAARAAALDDAQRRLTTPNAYSGTTPPAATSPTQPVQQAQQPPANPNRGFQPPATQAPTQPAAARAAETPASDDNSFPGG